MLTQAIEANARELDEFIAVQVSRFVREFQSMRVRVTPEGSEESLHAFVHPPYMLQSVTLVGSSEMFNQLEERHRARLQRVKAAREAASATVKLFLQERLYEKDGRERYVASGRGRLGEIGELLQEAVDQRCIPISRGKEYLDGYDLRQ